HFPLLVCQTPHIPLMDGEEPPRALELLCPLSDPANVGALIRTSLAFGVEKVILLKEAAHPFLPKSIRASGGAVFEQPLAWGPPLRGMEGKSWLVALDPTGEDLTEFLWPRAVRVLVGEEGRGLGDLRCANRLAIPMASHVQSLNAAVATSLALFSYRLQYPLSRAS
ncbi:MAG: TrmH family RNA methyltransferase, partial [Nitrospirae bacterium]